MAPLDAAIDRAKAGDAEAFAELYRAFSRRVYGLCRKLLGPGPAAEDARSEVFVRARQALDRYDPARPFGPWILTIASHHCLNLLRRQQRERRLFTAEGLAAERDADPAPSPLLQLQSAEEQRRLRAAIEALPENYRIPLVLKYYGELSYDEIADQLQLRRDNVAVLLFRAKRKLREAMTASDEETP